MDVKQAYDSWAHQYDKDQNKTRDLEAVALRENLELVFFERCLEVGCGTGKNTQWLASRAKQVHAVDVSEEMLIKAREKVQFKNVIFEQADIHKEWHFINGRYDLVVFSLILEHIEHLGPIIRKAFEALDPEGFIYIGELHPFKQYSGSKARFETNEGLKIVPCFNHHISDFTEPAKTCGLKIESINEYFDDNKRNGIPRIISLLLKKQ